MQSWTVETIVFLREWVGIAQEFVGSLEIYLEIVLPSDLPRKPPLQLRVRLENSQKLVLLRVANWYLTQYRTKIFGKLQCCWKINATLWYFIPQSITFYFSNRTIMGFSLLTIHNNTYYARPHFHSAFQSIFNHNSPKYRYHLCYHRSLNTLDRTLNTVLCAWQTV